LWIEKNRNLKEPKRLIMAQVMLRVLVVIVAVSFLVAGMGSLALVMLELRKAPKGYEDECGFHAVHRVRWGTLSPVQDKECSRSRTIRHPAIKNDSGAIP